MTSKSVRLFRKSDNRTKAPARATKASLSTTATKMRFAVVDLDVRAGFLPRVLDAINAGQTSFTFESVILTVRAGLTVSGKRTQERVKTHNQRISKADLERNVYVPDIVEAMKPMLHLTQYDAVGVTVASMLMDEDDGSLSWNLFSTGHRRIAVASAYGLRDYAEQAGRDFEACLAIVLCAALLGQAFPGIEWHEETLGCPFDYCENRDDIVLALRTPRVSEQALQRFPEWARGDVQRVFSAIGTYKRSPS